MKKRLVVRADEKLTAFLELEAVVSIAAPIWAAGMHRKRELLRHVSGLQNFRYPADLATLLRP
jgi:hypothetical protein